MLLPDRLTLMQRLQDAARNGFTHYTLGQVEPAKWAKLATKFAHAYETDLSKATRSRRRRAGQAVALLYGASPPPYIEAGKVTWALVVTEGKGRVHEREQLRELRAERIELDGYELVHDGVSWSWRMTQKRYRYWQDRIREICTKPPARRAVAQRDGVTVDPDIEQVLDALYNAPGFRLVRRQVGQLVTYARREWQRVRPENGPQLHARSFLPYVRRLPNARAKQGLEELETALERALGAQRQAR